MARLKFNTMRSRNSLRRWGWPGATGFILLALAAVLAVTWLPQLARRSHSLSVAAAEAEQQARRDRQRSVMPVATQSPAQRFAAAFPDPDVRETRIAALLASARAHGLSLQRFEFRLSREAQLGLLKYSLNLPLSGTYAHLRSFVEDTQSSDTAVVLERMRLQRGSARATVVDADMTWSFYMRAEPSEVEDPTPSIKTRTPTPAVNALPER